MPSLPIRRLSGAALLLLLALAPTVWAAELRRAQSGDQLINWYYGAVYGTGIYAAGDRTVGIVQLPFSRVLRAGDESRWGLELKVPVTFISGTQDRVVDPGHNTERLHERVEGSELHLQPGVGHMTHYAHPEQVLEAIEGIAGRAGAPLYLRNPQADARARASESGV